MLRASTACNPRVNLPLLVPKSSPLEQVSSTQPADTAWQALLAQDTTPY